MLHEKNMKRNAPIDVVDFHAHILPCADHGSSSIDMSIRQLTYASNFGVKRILATPHFYPNRDSVESFITRRDQAFNKLKCHLSDGAPQLRLGAEVLMCDGIERLSGLDKLFVNGTDTLLLELPYTGFAYEGYRSVRELVKCGVNVVIAHPERYAVNFINNVIDEGAVLQLNAPVISKILISAQIKKWMNSGHVVAVGSDIHRSDKRAYAMFKKAINSVGNIIDFIKEKSDIVWNCAKEI